MLIMLSSSRLAFTFLLNIIMVVVVCSDLVLGKQKLV